MAVGLRDIVTVVVNRWTRGSSQSKVVVPKYELAMRKLFFHVRVIQKWNNLSDHVVSLSAVKKALDLELDVLCSVLLIFFSE